MTGLKIRIETPLFNESIKFYGDYIGMTVLQLWDHAADEADNLSSLNKTDNIDRGAILGLGTSIDGEAFLEIAYTESPTVFPGLSLQVRVNCINDFIKKIQGKLTFEGPVERPWGSSYLYLTDPSGISVILYEGKL